MSPEAPSGPYARFGKRDLERTSWLAPLVNNRFGDLVNIELRHEQLFFLDGDRVLEDVGFSEKGTRFSEADFGKPIRTLEDLRKQGYGLAGRVYDADVMREALRRHKDGHDYSFFSNQCQDWADRLKRVAARVERERGIGPSLRARLASARTAQPRLVPTEPASIGMGCLALALGIGGVLAPGLAGSSFTTVLGAFFLVSGVSQVLYAVHGKDWGGLLPAMLSATVHFAAAAMLLWSRPFALATGSVVVAAALGINGVLNLVGGLTGRPRSHWIGKLIAGLVMLGVTAMVALRWPASGERVLGIAVGVSLLVGGLSTIWLSWRTRTADEGAPGDG